MTDDLTSPGSSQRVLPDPPPGPSLRLCLSLVLLGGIALAVLGAVFVPWSWVPGGELVPVRGSEVLSSRQLDRAEDYASMQRHLGWWSLAVSLVVGLGLGLTPAGARLARRLRGPWVVRALLATLAVLLIGKVATLPFALGYRQNALSYGLTEQGIAGWLRDQGTSLLVGWVFSGVLVLLVVGSARWSPRRWPVLVGVAGALLTMLGSWVYPVVVEPLFNQITPLADGSLRTRILDLAQKEQVPVKDVLVADASRRTTTLNAYVSGFGSTRRVVLYDNLVNDVPERETLVVVAHELGHARNHDVLLGTTMGAAGVVLGSGLLGMLLRRRSVLDRAGVRDAGQPEAAALLLALVTVSTLLASPVQNTVSRAVEARADRESLAATGDYAGFEQMQLNLAIRALSDDDPPAWSQFWFGSHPTVLQRIGLARALERAREAS